MSTNILDKTASLSRGGDGTARSYDPTGAFRSQVGMQKVVLHPTQNTAVGTPTLSQFGFPFARGECIGSGDVKVFAADKVTEIRAYVETVLHWQNWDGSLLRSVRSVSITIESTFSDNTTPVDVYVQWGLGGSSNPLAPIAFDATWIDYRTSGLQWANFINVPEQRRPSYDYDGTGYGMPLEDIKEPATWGVIDPKYIRKTGIFDYHLKYGIEDSDGTNCLLFYKQSAKTMTNDVEDHVSESNLTPYLVDTGVVIGNSVEPSGYATWLFDRASALYSLYGLTGELKDLIQAHRATYFYETKLSAGAFIFKSSRDLKYTYPRPLMTEMVLMGNKNAANKLTDIADFQDTWDHNYSYSAGSTKLWTERHLAYKLGAYRALYELTGLKTYKDSTIELFNVAYNLQQTPENGWPKDGSIRHTLNVHEAFGGDTPIGSPWMASLLAGEIKAYYEISKDDRALRVLADLGEWILNYGTRVSLLNNEITAENIHVPWYFASDSFQSSQASAQADDPFTDVAHCYDVASLMIKAVWAKKQLGEDYAAQLVRANEILHAASHRFVNLRRVNSSTVGAGKTFYRLSPTRKFNWWFANGYDAPALLEDLNNE